jgi:F-type H+-transporting ATPase subunit gamma
MASARAIKSRIKSTKNIQQITKAMQAVSAVKMRKSEAAALKGRPYALYALDILKKIEKFTGQNIKSLSPLFTENNVPKNCLVIISSDKGLAGAFNSNVIRAAEQIIKQHPETEIVAIGKKARDHFSRKGVTIAKDFVSLSDITAMDEAEEITKFILALFINKQYRKVDIIYTNFISALKQEVIVRPLLPVSEKDLNNVVESIVPKTGKYSGMKTEKIKDNFEYKFEPSPQEIVLRLVPKLVELEIFHSILEANASEHSARMVAMKNASENAKEMISSLTITYNKERQAQITKELIEITSGKNALEEALG